MRTFSSKLAGWLLLVLAPSFALMTTAIARADEKSSEATKVSAASIPQEQAEFFESKIRPVLSQHCQRCHGAKKQESGLRLDTRDGFAKGTDAGPIVEPGKPEESPLVEAVSHDGPVKMPPDTKLPPAVIADFSTWIRMGAPWPETHSAGTDSAKPAGDSASAARRPRARDHWAFQPVRQPKLPEVRGASRARTPVDYFILAKQEAKGLTLAPTADRRTLIRRASFDLLGLPPTAEEVATFEADPASDADAYARLVDRLLASPHYGERWGRHWLDIARYSDTKGYALFQDPNYPWAYTYRDYVVRAFNDDLPYDQFLIEQIAADRLLIEEKAGDKDPRRRSLPALGFITVGGRFMNNFHDVIDDRIDVVTRGVMGLTVTCARCHDHKFDPIPASDYYALYGVFASSAEPIVPPEFQAPPKTEAYAKYLQELKTRETALKTFVAAKHAEIVNAARSRAAEYLVSAQKALDQPTTEEFMLLADGADLNPMVLIRWQAFLTRTRKEKDPILAPWHALAAIPADQFAAKAPENLKRLRGSANAVVLDSLASEKLESLTDAAKVYSRLLNGSYKMGAEAALRSSIEKGSPRTLATSDWEAIRGVFGRADSPANIPLAPFGDLGLVPDRPAQAELQKLRTAFETWLNTGAGAPPRAMALEDSATLYEPRVFLRGNPNNLGEPVARRFLTVFSGEGDQNAAKRNAAPTSTSAASDPRSFRDGSGRLELARAIANRSNPLTARVLVNRVWMQHMGTPLVATPGDFGFRSEPPTHPELLDDLATAFMESGWSIKALHRRIMLSATYQQQSADRPEARAIDPENMLYARMNRRRLDFESLRDAMLAVAGRLDQRVGGAASPSATDPATPRRSLYTMIDRLNLPGLLRTFDFPDPNATSARRDQSTVAPQALFLMNHPFVIAAAKSLADRSDVKSATSPTGKLERLYRVAYGRAPSAEENAIAAEFLSQPDGTPSRKETAPSLKQESQWQEFAQAILMSNEFAFVD